MKSNISILKEQLESDFTVDGVEKIVKASFSKEFPKSMAIYHKNSLSDPEYMIFTFVLGNGSSEFPNNIRQNDPLNLSFTIDINKNPVSIVYSAASVSITPENRMYAFDRHKLKLRKTKVKTMKDLETKLDKAFKLVKTDIKTLIKNGDFSVHQPEFVAIYKKKVGA